MEKQDFYCCLRVLCVLRVSGFSASQGNRQLEGQFAQQLGVARADAPRHLRLRLAPGRQRLRDRTAAACRQAHFGHALVGRRCVRRQQAVAFEGAQVARKRRAVEFEPFPEIGRERFRARGVRGKPKSIGNVPTVWPPNCVI